MEGGVLEKPEHCPHLMFELMRLCWQFNPKMRPSFPEILRSVEDELQPSFRDLSFFYNQDTHTDTPPAPSLAHSPPVALLRPPGPPQPTHRRQPMERQGLDLGHRRQRSCRRTRT
ncbi:Insulin-like growth factor 1 receptor [Merluccius polli]|uniref:Insulin-like growth factor 1 receptor n=1 Tax=Merluccius polli TaxID=89951 RepID=A0AA47NU10_MERPO|nr:Insulin-like growth factor 1 receptor [Merluccius polli]